MKQSKRAEQFCSNALFNFFKNWRWCSTNKRIRINHFKNTFLNSHFTPEMGKSFLGGRRLRSRH